MPTKLYSDWSSPYDNDYTENQELFITEPTDGKINYFFPRSRLYSTLIDE